LKNSSDTNRSAIEVKQKAAPVRKALGTKSVNTDPVVSPRKTKLEKATEDMAKDLAAMKMSLETTTLPHSRPKQTEQGRSVTVPPPPASADIILDSMNVPPKTPANMDLFSPTSSAPSTAAPRDTPEPGITISEANGLSRPGRRARAQVNYAEPSLNSKMRRPGKEMVDAVGARGKPAAVRAEPKVKREQSEESTNGDRWTGVSASDLERENDAMANSPSFRKVTPSKIPQPTSEIEAKVVEAIASDEAVMDPASSSTTLRKRLGRSSQVLPAVLSESTINGMSDETRNSLAIFDFTDSSPQDMAALQTAPTKGRSSRSASTRRHSSVPSLPSSDQLQKGAGKEEEMLRRKTIKALTSTSRANAERETADGMDERLEKIAARRRSMML
jgi:hypothetical protein